MGGALRLVFGNETLDHHHVAPDAVQPRVALVNADLAKSNLREQRAAGDILDKDTRRQLPVAGVATRPAP